MHLLEMIFQGPRIFAPFEAQLALEFFLFKMDGVQVSHSIVLDGEFFVADYTTPAVFVLLP